MTDYKDSKLWILIDRYGTKLFFIFFGIALSLFIYFFTIQILHSFGILCQPVIYYKNTTVINAWCGYNN